MNKGIVKYKLSGYVRSGKEVVPIVVFVGWLGMMYSIGPVDVLGSFGLCSLLMFVVMMAIGITFSSCRNQMIEMSFLVKLKDKKQLYTSNLAVIYLFGGVLTVVGMGVPVLVNFTSGFSLFNRTLTATDVFAGGALLFLVAICGGVIGQFADKRIINNQRLAVLIGITMALIIVFKDGLIEKLPLLRYVLWILPPVSKFGQVFNEMQEFSFGQSGKYFVWIIIYIFVLQFLYIKTMLHRKMD